jgi:hypothetical protein
MDQRTMTKLTDEERAFYKTLPAHLGKVRIGALVELCDQLTKALASADNCTHDPLNGCETRLGKAERRWQEWEARATTAEATASKALTLLARAQDGSPKRPREANSHSVQLDYDIGQLLQRAGFVWDAIHRQWRAPKHNPPVFTEPSIDVTMRDPNGT